MKTIVRTSLIIATLFCTLSAIAQTRLDPAVAELAKSLNDVKYVDDTGTIEPPTGMVNPRHPAIALPDIINTVARLSKRYKELPAVQSSLTRAYDHYRGGTKGVDLAYLSRTAYSLQDAQDLLSRVKPYDKTIQSLQTRVNDVLLEMARNAIRVLYQANPDSRLYAVATRVFAQGIAAMEKLQYDQAAIHFSDIQDLTSNSVTFDIELFEQNIINAMEDNAVGYALSIAFQGNEYNGGHAEGQARTAADGPAVAQSVHKEMHVASVSKPLTTIVVLDLLDQLGLTPDTKVWPYLPSGWAIHGNSYGLSFRDFLTHTSGADQAGMGSSYDALREFIENGPGADQSFSYNNGNFGMMRVLVAGLMGIDASQVAEFPSDVLTASAFIIRAQSLYDNIGVNIGCSPNDANPTIQYNFPDAGVSGYEEPDRSLGCGGFGWFISASELSNVVTHLRNSEELLSTNARDWMQDGFLGLNNPADYPWSSGTFGTYYNHGGDWLHGTGEAHACFMAFPIQVEASLLINSERGPGIPYQCTLLKNAFEAAWTL